MLVVTFWILAFCALFSYFLYPVILTLLVKISTYSPPSLAPVTSDADVLPKLTVIITAHNEESRIREKIENTLNCDYPIEQLEIIVASDGSTDKTNSITQEYADRNILLVCPKQRQGKENAQKHAIEVATGHILVFSDVATHIPDQALKLLTAYFRDPTIGAISSEDRLTSNDGSITGESSYVKYEMWLRKQESRLAGLIGLSGSFFAARAEICTEWDIHSPSDFNTAINCAKNNVRAVTAPDVLGYYSDLKDPTKEYKRKIRTVIRGMTALTRHTEVLNPFKFKLFSFQVFSHKLMRWLEPWFLLGLLITSILLTPEHAFFLFILVVQILFYGIAVLAHYKSQWQENSVVRIIYFFVQVNLALMDASLKFLFGHRMTTWKPSSR